MRNSRKPSIPAPEGFYGCSRCRTVKPHSEFYPRPNGPCGHESYCKACKVEYTKERAGRPDPNGAERFWSHVAKRGPNECWEWTASLDGRGYGQFWYMGRIKKAYQVALILAGVEPPKRKDGKCIDHTCRNALCVNPAHLRIVTDAVNAIENNDTPFSQNHRKTHCKHGHPLSGDNIIWMHCRGPKGTRMKTRVCLTCRPHMVNTSKRTTPPEHRTE